LARRIARKAGKLPKIAARTGRLTGDIRIECALLGWQSSASSAKDRRFSPIAFGLSACALKYLSMGDRGTILALTALWVRLWGGVAQDWEERTRQCVTLASKACGLGPQKWATDS
jgi:hypothetical protein